MQLLLILEAEADGVRVPSEALGNLTSRKQQAGHRRAHSQTDNPPPAGLASKLLYGVLLHHSDYGEQHKRFQPE